MGGPFNVQDAFELLFQTLQAEKPNDRSDRDRAYAIVKTEVEKAFAYYVTFASPVGILVEG